MKLFITLLLCASLAGCSALGATSALTSALSPSDGTHIEAQVGKENTKQIVGQQNDTTNTANRDIVTVMNQDIPIWIILLMLLGWMLPRPTTMAAALVRLLRRKQ